MSKAMKVLLGILFVFTMFASAEETSRVSEGELVTFLNEKGYSIISDETQDVSIRYNEEQRTWSVLIRGKCTEPNCVCIDCDSAIGVRETSTGLEIAGIVLDG